MHRHLLCTLVAVLSLMACAGIAQRSKLDKFEEMDRTYKQALLASDFAGAARLIDPTANPKPFDPAKARLLKIVDYKPTHVDVSEDLLTIKQQVSLKYFMLNTNLLRTMDYQQTWKYKEDYKVWLLQTELPDLIP
jgi:hypothetical protein